MLLGRYINNSFWLEILLSEMKEFKCSLEETCVESKTCFESKTCLWLGGSDFWPKSNNKTVQITKHIQRLMVLKITGQHFNHNIVILKWSVKKYNLFYNKLSKMCGIFREVNGIAFRTLQLSLFDLFPCE